MLLGWGVGGWGEGWRQLGGVKLLHWGLGWYLVAHPTQPSIF